MFNVLKQHRIIYAYLLGFVGVLCFAATLPLTTVHIFSPAFITVIRAVIAELAACLWVFQRLRLTRTDEIKPLVVDGLGLVFGFPTAMAIGLQSVPSYHGAVVLGILPLVTPQVYRSMVAGYRARLGFWVCAVVGTSLVVVFTLGARWVDELGRSVARIGRADGIFWLRHRWEFSQGTTRPTGNLLVTDPSISDLGDGDRTCLAGFFWVRPDSSLMALLALGLFSMFFGFFAWNTDSLWNCGIAEVGQVQLLQLFLTLIWGSILIGEVVTIDVWVFAVAGRGHGLPRAQARLMQWTIDAAGARDLDRRISESGVEEFCLMMRASKVATDHLLRSKPTSVVCLAGSGNNGGDAYGVAAHLLLTPVFPQQWSP